MVLTRMRRIGCPLACALRTLKSAGLLLATLAGLLPVQPAAVNGERLLVFTKTLGLPARLDFDGRRGDP